ncbi:MFS transporter [Pseudooceanicola sp. GBMRC 2024]|uniref:MFS transporter n=1 Tax=Pseudooceanicola albus TaxID=2692189 RepID=A0A6L7G111_9RHOB|nr:MFS transporter [Pseudooceanicola albus]MXN17741.1 MFS transporter [Pseudooceanicola albus]
MGSLRFKEKFGYGFGDLANNLIFNSVTTYLMFFYTDHVGLSAATASTLFLVARIWDAVSDPMMGALADRTRTRWGRFRPYLLLVPVPFAVIAVLTYSSPDLGATGKVAWACLTYFLLMTLYTAVNIPYASLAATMTRDPDERAQLTTFRMIFSFGGGMIVNLITLPLVYWWAGSAAEGGDQIGGYRFAIIVLAGLSIVFYWLCFALTRERTRPDASIAHDLRAEIRLVTTSRAWWMLLGMGISMFALGIFPFYVGMYFLKYVFLKETFASSYFTLCTLGMLAGALMNLALVRRYDRRLLAVGAGIWGAVFSLGIYLVAPGNTVLLGLFAFLSFMGTGIGAPNLWAMVGDTADDIERRSGRQIAGLTSAAVSFSMKLGLGIGGAAVGYILAAYGFQPNVAAAPATQGGILMMTGLFPAIGYLLLSLFAFGFPRPTGAVAPVTAA